MLSLNKTCVSCFQIVSVGFFLHLSYTHSRLSAGERCPRVSVGLLPPEPPFLLGLSDWERVAQQTVGRNTRVQNMCS